MTLISLSVIHSALANTLITSRLWGNAQEIAAGGVTNQVWTLFIQLALLTQIFFPFGLLWPGVNFSLWQYAAMGITLLAGGLSYVFHSNEQNRRLGNTNGIIHLPFDLHQSRFLRNLSFGLSSVLSLCFVGIYALGIGVCAYYGMYTVLGYSAAMIVVDLVYQRGWLPSVLNRPYDWSCRLLITTSVFGVSSWFGLGVTALLCAHLLWDALTTYVFKTRTGNQLFPLSKQPLQFKLTQRPQTSAHLLELARGLKEYPVHLTFNHCRKAYDIGRKILAKAPNVNFETYLTLFKKIDFNQPELQGMLGAQFVVQDQFYKKTLDEHRNALKLHTQAPESEIKIAYLVQEMCYTVERLRNGHSSGLSQEHILSLNKYARYVLKYIEDHWNIYPETCQRVLIEIALRAGSHCNRMYVDTFSEVFHRHIDSLPEHAALTEHERLILAMQDYRDKCFREYYYYAVRCLKDKETHFGLVLYNDEHDYHTYEAFSEDVGMTLYLRNSTVEPTTARTLDQIFSAYVMRCFFQLCDIPSFNTFYAAEKMIEAILKAGEAAASLHKSFRVWCETTVPGSYEELVLDDVYLVREESEDVRNLVKLMLLDNGIVDLDRPYGTPAVAPQRETERPRVSPSAVNCLSFFPSPKGDSSRKVEQTVSPLPVF